MDGSLRGVMIWSLDNDVKGEKSLLGAIDQVLTAGVAKPKAGKPQTKYNCTTEHTETQRILGKESEQRAHYPGGGPTDRILRHS